MTDKEQFQPRFDRQLDIVSLEKLCFPIIVIGAGAIGSAVVVTLAKMGCSDITVWDMDTLEDVNVPNQLCKLSMVGRAKTEALAELVNDLSGIQIKRVIRAYEGRKWLSTGTAAPRFAEGLRRGRQGHRF